MERREFLNAVVGATWWPLLTSGCAHGAALSPKCLGGPVSNLEVVPRSQLGAAPALADRTVFRVMPTMPPKRLRAIVVLHELPGLTAEDRALAICIAKAGFAAYVPVLFGGNEQDNAALGFLQACVTGKFECSALSKRSAVLDWLGPLCDRVGQLSDGPIGVLGMCLTGILPLALLRPGVEAAVVCQPTIPFSTVRRRPVGPQMEDLGLDPKDLEKAIAAKVPFLAMRYASDVLCPSERMNTLRTTFDGLVATIELPDAPENRGHTYHSVLASSFNGDAFADTIDYLKARLEVDPDPKPKPMRLALLGKRKCEITPEGTWREQ